MLYISLYYSCQIERVAIMFQGQFYFYVICFSFLKYFNIKKNWYAYNDREFNKNYLFLMILFNIKFTIKFSLSLSLSLSLALSKYIYIYIFNWLSHPIVFNIFFILQASIVFSKSCHCSELPRTWKVVVLEFWTI